MPPSLRLQMGRYALVCLLMLSGLMALLAANAQVQADEPAPTKPAKGEPKPGVGVPTTPNGKTPPLTGRLDLRQGQRVLTLWGTPRERGFTQGFLLAEEIVGGLERDFGAILKPLLPSYELVLKKTVIPSFQFDDRETAELEGLLAGMRARLPKAKRRLAVLNRELELVDLKALNTVGDWYGLGCSSLAVWGSLSADGAPLVGRNFDFPAFELVLGSQHVVIRAPDGTRPGQLGVSYPGCIGTLTGMNRAGVFVAVHDVAVRAPLEKALRPNVPRLLAVRRLLEQGNAETTCQGFQDLVQSWPTLYGNNLMVVGPSKGKHPCVAVLEYDSRLELEQGCTLRLPGRAGTAADALPLRCLACTNHHRLRKTPETIKERGARWRYPKLACIDTTERPKRPLDVAAMFRWMQRTSFPRDGKPQGRATSLIGPGAQHGTLHQVVAQPGSQVFHVRLGRVGQHISKVATVPYVLAEQLDKLRSAAPKAAPQTGKK